MYPFELPPLNRFSPHHHHHHHHHLSPNAGKGKSVLETFRMMLLKIS
jgi:hypothetical protein